MFWAHCLCPPSTQKNHAHSAFEHPQPPSGRLHPGRASHRHRDHGTRPGPAPADPQRDPRLHTGPEPADGGRRLRPQGDGRDRLRPPQRRHLRELLDPHPHRRILQQLRPACGAPRHERGDRPPLPCRPILDELLQPDHPLLRLLHLLRDQSACRRRLGGHDHPRRAPCPGHPCLSGPHPRRRDQRISPEHPPLRQLGYQQLQRHHLSLWLERTDYPLPILRWRSHQPRPGHGCLDCFDR